MRILDFLAARRRRCIVLGCTNKPNGRSNLCADHEADMGEKLKRAIARVDARRGPRRVVDDGDVSDPP